MPLEGYLMTFVLWPHRYRTLGEGYRHIAWVDDNYNVHQEEGWAHGDTWSAYWPALRTCKIADLPPLNHVSDVLMHSPKKYE